MFKKITLNPDDAEAKHPVKMVDWRTGETWVEMSAEAGAAIPQPINLDPAKIAEAQRQSERILRDFGRL